MCVFFTASKHRKIQIYATLFLIIDICLTFRRGFLRA